MRKDQTQIIKEFNLMYEYISLLERSIDEQQVEIDYLKEENNNFYQDMLINRIEHDRLLFGKVALTSKHAAIREMAEAINLM